MKKDSLLGSKKIHFIGIGGIGMSALAGILMEQGKKISGSDKERNATIDQLENNGATIFIGHSKENLPADAETVVYSLAIPQRNPELIAAKKKRIPILSYPEAVGELTKQYFTIAVCGTHGKSTITALVSKVLMENNFDPTVIVGTKLRELDDKNFRVGKSKLLVLEACEYCRAFLNYSPRAIILHTLDPDHLDYYRDFNDYLDAFREFVNKLPPDGYFFTNLDDDDIHPVLQTLQREKFPAHNTFTYSTMYSNCDSHLDGNKIKQQNELAGILNLKIPGKHNRTNALAAFALCATFGITPKNILKSLNNYRGAYRRYEIKGRIGKTLVIDDYAHHPAEIEATLQAAREQFPKKKICVVFQPHQYNRTKKLLNDFAECFAKADCVIVPDIYEVRDTKNDQQAITPEQFTNEVRKHHGHGEVLYGKGLFETTKYLKKHHSEFDVIFIMGAGDVWKIADSLLQSK